MNGIVSIVKERSCRYPSPSGAYGPGQRYPEYLFATHSPAQGMVYEQVRKVFAQANLDSGRFGTKDWNPLGPWIRPGNKVFVLCNFVQHRRPTQSLLDEQAKCVHGSVLRAICDYVLLALKGQGTITFGNAPLQSTDWRAVLAETGAAAVEEFYRDQDAPVRSLDLRMMVRPRSVVGYDRGKTQTSDLDSCIAVDLSKVSLIEEIVNGQNGSATKFRVMDYNPDLTEAFQNSGRHIYLVHRAILEADVVISLAKLKTHEKVGVTCGLKGFVGTIGRKDCLAHHRLGSSAVGGDEYPSGSTLRYCQSRVHDWINRRGNGLLRQAGSVIDRNVTRILSRLGAIYGGAWHGNDTCWRMALDLARIAYYADHSGNIALTPQRRHLCFIDGIIAGENKGPLSPSPVPAGCIVLASDPALADVAACQLMGYDPSRIPLVREAFGRLVHEPASLEQAMELPAVCNGKRTPLRAVEPALARPFRPSPGWRQCLAADRKWDFAKPS